MLELPAVTPKYGGMVAPKVGGYVATMVEDAQSGHTLMCEIPASFESFCEEHAPEAPAGHDRFDYCARFLNELALQQGGGDLCAPEEGCEWEDVLGSACRPAGRAACDVDFPEWLGDGQCDGGDYNTVCLLYTSPSPRDRQKSRMPSSA